MSKAVEFVGMERCARAVWSPRLRPERALAVLQKRRNVSPPSPCPPAQGRPWGARASSELLDPVAFAADPVVTWQVTAGAIAGVTPFVVAGIEFSKRIALHITNYNVIVSQVICYFNCQTGQTSSQLPTLPSLLERKLLLFNPRLSRKDVRCAVALDSRKGWA